MVAAMGSQRVTRGLYQYGIAPFLFVSQQAAESTSKTCSLATTALLLQTQHQHPELQQHSLVGAAEALGRCFFVNMCTQPNTNATPPAGMHLCPMIVSSTSLTTAQ